MDFESQEPPQQEPQAAPSPERAARTALRSMQLMRPWRMALMLASSAMLGGITVALWNRKALQELRQGQASPVQEMPAPGDDWDGEEYI